MPLPPNLLDSAVSLLRDLLRVEDLAFAIEATTEVAERVYDGIALDITANAGVRPASDPISSKTDMQSLTSLSGAVTQVVD